MRSRLTKSPIVLCAALACATAFAQRPSNPALLIPQRAPELDYVAVPNPLPLPDGIKIGAPSAIRYDSQGHMFLLNRGPQSLVEFDEKGKFIRIFGDGLLKRAHAVPDLSGFGNDARHLRRGRRELRLQNFDASFEAGILVERIADPEQREAPDELASWRKLPQASVDVGVVW